MKNSKLISLGLSLSVVSRLFVGCSEDAATVAGPLEGTWSTACDYSLSDGSSYMEITSFSGSTMNSVDTEYEGNNGCTTTATQSVTIVRSGSFALGTNTDITAGEVTDIDYTNVNVIVTLKTATMVTDWNNMNMCNKTWVLNAAQSVIGCDYTGDGISDIETSMYDIVELNTTAPSTIKFASDANTTAATRPTVIDTWNVFTKQ